MMIVPTSAQSSAPSRSRGRARPEGGAAAGDPAPARAFVRLDHERVSTRDRCRGDHRHDPCAARTDDARQRRSRALKAGGAEQTGGRAARRNRPPAPARTRPLLEIAAAEPLALPAWSVLLKRAPRGMSVAAPPLRREAVCGDRPSSSDREEIVEFEPAPARSRE